MGIEMICKWVGHNQINGPVYAEERFLQYIMEHQKKNVMLRCGVLVIAMGMVGRLFNDKSKNSFWERRIENKKRIENQVKKQQGKKADSEKNKRKEQLMKNMRKIKGYPLRMPELDWWLRVVRLLRLSQ